MTGRVGMGGLAALGLAAVSLFTPRASAAQETPAQNSLPSEGKPDPFLAEIIRARVLARLGRTEEALSAFADLLERKPDDKSLREDYVETLIDARFYDRAQRLVELYLTQDPRSIRMRRLASRLDLERDRPQAAAERLEALRQDAPNDSGLMADLATAEARQGRWAKALGLYHEVLERDPDNDSVRAAQRAIVVDHAPRIEVRHRTFFQESATSHIEELAWRGWVAERWWLRSGLRYASYHQDSTSETSAFTEDMGTFFALLGFQWNSRWSARLGVDESLRGDTLRTTARLGATYDDGRATAFRLDSAFREPLTNPVTAVPRGGTTDRVTVDLSRRLIDRFTLSGHYEYDHYRASGTELGHGWEALGRLDIELLRGRVQAIFSPQAYVSEYTPTAGDPLRDVVSFLRRQQVLGVGLLLGADPLPGLHVQAGSVGRRDFYRAITSYEVTGEVKWRFTRFTEFEALYTRNTEGSRVGGKEESFNGTLRILH